MKNIYGFKILFFLLFLNQNLFCQWEQCKGPYGGSINTIAVHDSNIFAATGSWLLGGNVFLSTNSGKSWNAVNSGLSSNWMSDLAITADGEEIFAFAEAVYYSTNKGASWTNIGPKFPSSVIATAMAIYPNDSGRTSVLVGTLYHGLYITSDLGRNWKELNSSFRPEITSISVIGQRIFIPVPNEIYISTNGGKNWKPAASVPKYPDGRPAWAVNIVPGPDTTTLFACTYAGVFISKDNGENWTAVNSGMTDQIVNCLAFSGENIFAGTLDGVYKSIDNGNKWVHMGLKNMNIRTLAVQNIKGSPDINLFAGPYAGEGIFLSTNLGESWTEVNEGLACANIGGLIVMPDKSGNENLFAGHFERGIMKSTDNGTSWTKMDAGLQWQDGFPNAFSFHDKYLAVSTAYSVYLSSNFGQNWNNITKNLSGYNNCCIWALLACSDNEGGTNILLGIGNELYRTKVDSTKYIPWERLNIGSFEVRSLAVKGKNIFTAVERYIPSTEKGIYRSSDNGKSWAPVNSGLPENPDVSALAVSGKNIFAAVYGKGIYLSSVNGDDWEKLAPGLPDSVYVNSFAVSGTNLFACTKDNVNYSNDNSIYFSNDNGTNWKKISEGLPYTYLGALAPGSSYLFAATYGAGVWRLPLSKIAVDIKSPPELPLKFSLEQNYPNPFNPSTAIKFAISKASYVTLRIYNSLGEFVTELVSKNLSRGEYTVRWNADASASGVYFYQLKAGNFIETRKMILLR